MTPTEINTPANNDVLNKYQAAADLANRNCFSYDIGALVYAIGLCQEGAKVAEVCAKADEHLVKLASTIYNKGGVSKGIAFPCCISVNSCLCHNAPLGEDGEVMHGGDLVKIELGAHIDGFPALVAHSLVVGASPDAPAQGPAAQVVQAAYEAAEAALRLVKAGNRSDCVREPIKQIAETYGGSFIEGMISHSVAKDALAGNKALIVSPSSYQAKSLEEYDFEPYDVFVIDIAISLGSGKVKPTEGAKTTVYCRTGAQHSLKLKTSRQIFSEIGTQFGNMAFNLR